jgi:hypothetical protein
MFLLERCKASPVHVPALTRLLRESTSLTSLCVIDENYALLDAPAAALLAAALQATTTVRVVCLNGVCLWEAPALGVAIVRALTGHASVAEINLGNNHVFDDARSAVCAALVALVTANAPALQELYLQTSLLGDAVLGPLLDALAHNTHLRTLCCSNTDMSERFARKRLLPAIRANASLRTLDAGECWGNQMDSQAPPEVLRAEALVAARTAADAAAA